MGFQPQPSFFPSKKPLPAKASLAPNTNLTLVFSYRKPFQLTLPFLQTQRYHCRLFRCRRRCLRALLLLRSTQSAHRHHASGFPPLPPINLQLRALLTSYHLLIPSWSLQKIPVLGDYFRRDIPPEDNVSFPLHISVVLCPHRTLLRGVQRERAISTHMCKRKQGRLTFSFLGLSSRIRIEIASVHDIGSGEGRGGSVKFYWTISFSSFTLELPIKEFFLFPIL